jgi:hypothetical protein
MKGKGSDKIVEALKDSGISKNDPDSKFNKRELAIGAKIELEHVDDIEAAKEIAKDHLIEDKNYYKKDLFAEERAKAVKTLQKSKIKLTMEAVMDFLLDNPNPEDYVLHEWAESKGFNVHAVEELVYQMATVHAQKHMGKSLIILPASEYRELCKAD